MKKRKTDTDHPENAVEAPDYDTVWDLNQGRYPPDFSSLVQIFDNADQSLIILID